MKFLMHENCLDACIEVLKMQYRDDKRIILKARWWTLGYTGNPWVLNYNFQTIKIKLSDWNKWHNITPRLNIPRTKPGLP